MKKLLSLILALILCIGLAAPVLADEDVYLLGDEEGTRMAPAFFWDMPFTGTSTITYQGNEVTVYHFPEGAEVGFDDWSYIPKIFEIDAVKGTAADESSLFDSGVPFALPKTNIIYRLVLVDFDGKECKEYFVKVGAESNPPSDWAKAEVDAARAAGIIPTFTGNPGYQDTITREQFAELIVQFVTVACGKAPELDTTLSFTDCTNSAVMLAASAGIVNGVGNDKFDPTAATNREQIATMIYRAINYVKKTTGTDLAPKSANLDGFTDKAQLSTWASEGVGVLAANGIMKGTSDTTLSPKNSCTLEQSILLAYRVYVLGK